MVLLLDSRQAWCGKSLEKQEEWKRLGRGINSTSSPCSSSLTSASGSGGKSSIHLILFTMPSVFIVEIGTPELEYIGLPPTGMGPPTLVYLATSLCLEPVIESRCQYPFKKTNQFTYKQNTLKYHQE
ncbi:hypothetical protein O181_055183 [Austropuccinia psidii MF-1]|uniref:Uncharacterized protein n=1 Tax=Austropuccinia psidii MF-1 TaxID=1389203 RepID=A0A9Q3HS61_9BASI|nr:hypothetical protein [Austropuccinia psidii MF-1]